MPERSHPEETIRGMRVRLFARFPGCLHDLFIPAIDRTTVHAPFLEHYSGGLYASTRDPETAEKFAPFFREIARKEVCDAAEHWPPETFDAIILDALANPNHLARDLRLLAPLLKETGYFFLLLPDRDALAKQSSDTIRKLPSRQEAEAAAHDAGLRVYHAWDSDEPAALEHLLVFTQQNYDPVAHADALTSAGRPDEACQCLDFAPAPSPAEKDAFLRLETARLETLLAWMRVSKEDPRRFMVKANQIFYRIMAVTPVNHSAARTQAEGWRYCGCTDLARRILESMHQAQPEEATARQCNSLPMPEPDQAITAPAWDGTPVRILFIMHPRFHYGLDVVYDGLRCCLDEDAVIEFPWKGTLHGEPVPEGLAHYPCAFDWPGSPWPLEKVLDELRSGCFDIILWGDCEGALDPAVARRILLAGRRLPVYIYDALDDFADNRELVMARTGMKTAGCFKREMLREMDYGPDCFPLPFAYPENRIPDTGGEEARDIPLFWAGHRKAGLRRLYLDTLEKRYTLDLNRKYSQPAYRTALTRSRMGLNCFGFGFDTVRYWELPAHGCLLLSEKPPIRIPENFQQEEEALFFRNLDELSELFERYRDAPETCAAIAEAGKKRLRRHHSGTARARQMLGWMTRRQE
jgi:hypothetical protein